MATMLIAQNETRESGSFMGDQLCSLKTAYLFAENRPVGVDKIVMSVSPDNEMHFLWERFIQKYDVELVWDNFNTGDWSARFGSWDTWRAERRIEGRPFDHYRELYLRIHGAQRQAVLCGAERGLGRRNIYEYWWFGQEDKPETPPRDVDEWDCYGIMTPYSFGDGLIDHPPLTQERDVYISPHAKTQGNVTFTFDFWADVVRRLVDAGVSVTVGYNGYFCPDLATNPYFVMHWSDHRSWMHQVCRHKLVACGNTGTGWLAAACGVPMVTMEPPNSVMADHRYRECGLRNIVEVVSEPDAVHVAAVIRDRVKRRLVMTTGCYDVIHAGHIRHLEKSRTMGTRLVVAMNSDASVRKLKGDGRPINSQDQRRAVLEALRCVDEVRVFDGMDARPLIQELHPDVLTNGFGYTPDIIVGRDIVESYGGQVAVTCNKDAKDEPSTTKVVKRMREAGVVDICRLAAGYSVNPLEKLRLLAEELLSVLHLPGDIADLGTCRGGTGLIMRRLAPEKYLHLFDTWEGTPYDDPLCHHKRGEWKASLEECKKLVGDGVTTYWCHGIFPQTTKWIDEAERFCFVYVDMDTYQATRDAVEFFWPCMVVGGKLVLDDYGWEPCAGVKKVVDEHFASDMLRVIGTTCIVEKR